jgi:tetratricopeptide (TPR) repeat protein
LKQIDAALKKYSGNQLLRALRSFALQRLGRSEEARAVLEGLVKDVPESERVLHTMTFTYKALGKSADIITAFEKAAEKQPNDGDIQLGLFSAYGREMKFAKQQQVALKLTKLDPGNADRYGWWVVACIALQAREAAQNQDSTRALQFMRLAETMLDRHVARFGRRLPSYEALLLHVDLLQGQGKVDDAVVAVENFLKDEGDATKKKASTGGTATERAHLLAAALARAGRFDPAAEIYKSECMKNVEDWWSWKLYLDCKLGLGSRERVLLAKDSTSMYFPVGVVGGLAETWDRKHLAEVFTAYHRTQTSQSSMCEVETTLQDLKKAAGGGLTRGVALAIVELAVRQQDDGSSGLQQGPILEALEVLAPTFSCAADLHGYLSHFTPRDEQATEVFVRETRRVCEREAARIMGVDDAPHAELKALQCLVNAATLAEEIRAPVCPDYAAAFDEAAGHVALFARHLHVSGT